MLTQILLDRAPGLKQTTTPRTHLVGKAGPDSGGDTLLQVGVLKDDGGVLAPQLQGELLAVGSAQLCDPLSSGLAPGEGDDRHLRVGHQGLAYPGPCSEHNVYHTWWHTWMRNSIRYRKSSQYVKDFRLCGDCL